MKNSFSLLIMFSFLICISCNKEKATQELNQETVYISGKVTCQNGEPLAGVKILINKNNEESQDVFSTLSDGRYEIKLLEKGANYTFQLDYEDASLNDEKDLENLGFLLTEKPTIDAFTQIAGDLNQSGTITAFDKIQLEQRIEHKEPSEWKVVPAGLTYTEDNGEFIFPNEFSKTLSITNYDGIPIVQDFVGIKIGDIDKSICD